MNILQNTLKQPRRLVNIKTVSTMIYLLSFIFIGMGYGAVGPTVPFFAQKFGLDVGAFGMIFTMRAIGGMTGSLLVARLFDRFNSHRLLALLIILLGICFIAIPLTGNLILLFAIALICGVLEISVDVGGNTLILWLHKKKATPYMNALHVCFGIGAFIAPVFIGYIMSRQGDILPAYSLMALPVLLCIPFMLTPAPKQTRTVSEQKTKNKPATGLTAILIFCLFFFFYAGLEAGFGGWLPAYSIKMGYLDKVTGSYLASLFFLLLTTGRLITIPLSTRIKTENLLVFNSIGTIISLIIIILPFGVTGLWIGAAGLGLSISSLFPGVFAIVESRMRISGKISGYFTAGASIGAMTIPWLIGKVIQFDLAFYFTWICLVMAVLILVIILCIRRTPVI